MSDNQCQGCQAGWPKYGDMHEVVGSEKSEMQVCSNRQTRTVMMPIDQAKRIAELERVLYFVGQELEQIGLDTIDIEDALGGDEGIKRVESEIACYAEKRG